MAVAFNPFKNTFDQKRIITPIYSDSFTRFLLFDTGCSNSLFYLNNYTDRVLTRKEFDSFFKHMRTPSKIFESAVGSSIYAYLCHFDFPVELGNAAFYTKRVKKGHKSSLPVVMNKFYFYLTYCEKVPGVMDNENLDLLGLDFIDCCYCYEKTPKDDIYYEWTEQSDYLYNLGVNYNLKDNVPYAFSAQKFEREFGKFISSSP